MRVAPRAASVSLRKSRIASNGGTAVPARTRFGRVAVTHQARFRRSARLRLPTEFQRCFTHGERVNGRYFRLHVLRAESMRLGLAVSRKVDPNAVGRNRIKRVAREFFRTTPALPQPGDCVLVAKPEAARANAAELRADLAQLWRKASALKHTAAAGTMRDASPPPASTSDG